MLTDIEPYTDADNSVRPSRDTGFRMVASTTTTPYVRKNVQAATRSFIEYLHWDDMIDVGPGTLRGQPLDSVRVYNINHEQAEKRAVGLIRKSVMLSQGDTPCRCLLPGSVPCTECGAGC
jgi:hypothetical protein